MNIKKSHTACFSGYVPEKFLFPLGNKNGTEYIKFCNNINAAISDALNLGYNTFLCGMAKGFDLMCAQTVLKFREEQNNIKLITVLPFKTHSFVGEWGEIHRMVRCNADDEVIISPNNFTRGDYQLCNLFMVENSSHLICYWSGQEGGTAQTIRMAEKHSHSIHNLWCAF